jgi:hypothetical protein
VGDDTPSNRTEKHSEVGGDHGEHQADCCQRSTTEMVAIDRLLPADSPRLEGENAEHIRMLADSDAVLPPITVHRASMRVIDGMHRLRAAILRGESSIEVQFFDGSEVDAFVMAVEHNIRHGLPLARTDRAAAAVRVVQTHPHWSDRMIAAKTGLAAKTVAAIRRRSTAASVQSNARIGADGRIRPLSSAAGRERAGRLIRMKPDAPLREIAREAGVAPSTVWEVRKRLLAGEEPVPPAPRTGDHRGDAALAGPGTAKNRQHGAAREPDLFAILQQLRSDPSLKFSEAGRTLLRWLNVNLTGITRLEGMIDNIPPHWSHKIAEFAYRNAATWQQLGARLEHHALTSANNAEPQSMLMRSITP